jgi:hypothetical protein
MSLAIAYPFDPARREYIPGEPPVAGYICSTT